MELFFLAVLFVLMIYALGSGYPVAFALPGSAIVTILLAGFLVSFFREIVGLISYRMARLSG